VLTLAPDSSLELSSELLSAIDGTRRLFVSHRNFDSALLRVAGKLLQHGIFGPLRVEVFTEGDSVMPRQTHSVDSDHLGSDGVDGGVGLEDFAAGINDLIAAFDDDWRYTFISENAAAFTGHRPDDLLGKNVWEMFPWAIDGPFYRGVHAAAAAGQPRCFEAYYETQQCWLQHRVFPSRPGVFVCSSDITGRRRADERVRNFETIIESSEDAIVGSTLLGEISSWNDGAVTLFGYSRDQAVGRSILMLTPTEFRDEMARILGDVREGYAVKQFETVQRSRDGECIHVSLRVCPIHDWGGGVIGTVSIARDVTQRILLEERVRQSQKNDVLVQLAQGIAHDFNNLLTVIQACSELLTNRLPHEPSSELLAAEIQRSLSQAASLIKRLLFFGRKQARNPTAVDLNSLIGQAQELLKHAIGPRIEVDIQLDSKVAAIWADPTELDQSLLNLALNARDAMPLGGRITIRTESVTVGEAAFPTTQSLRPGSYIALVVSDTGSGMDPAIQARIFEPFFTTKISTGAGLGLAIVRSIVQHCAGHIEVESRVGAGTTFKLYFPKYAL
jgi:PAS domain S-box-containing protein